MEVEAGGSDVQGHPSLRSVGIHERLSKKRGRDESKRGDGLEYGRQKRRREKIRNSDGGMDVIKLHHIHADMS